LHVFIGEILANMTQVSDVAPGPLVHLYGDVPIAGEGLQIYAYARRLGPLSRERSLSRHTYFDTGPRFFPVSSEGPPHSIASYDTHGDAEDLF
jgi:hypothetical protein